MIPGTDLHAIFEAATDGEKITSQINDLDVESYLSMSLDSSPSEEVLGYGAGLL